MNNKTKGFIYGAIAAASYGMNPLFALPLYARNECRYRFILPLFLCRNRAGYSDENAASILYASQGRRSALSHYGIVVLFLIVAPVYEL